MAITIKDVAQRAGVSHPTVSRALRGDRSVTPETARRIRRIAHELGYIPDAGARSLKTSRTRVIGVLVHRVSDPFYSRVLDGIHDSLYPAGYSVFLASTNNDRTRQAEIIRAMIERRVDGLIMCSMFVRPQDLGTINPHGLPLVLIHNRAEEITPYTLYHDDREGARELTRHLLELGHERIAFLGNARAGRVSQERLSGFRQQMQTAGLEISTEYIVHAASGLPDAAQDPVQALLTLDKPPTALVCFDDMLALGAMQVLHNAGKRIPDDWSITGFDDIALAELVSPPLTTFKQPKYTLGAQAVNLLLRAMNSPSLDDPTPDTITLRGEIIVRSSTAPPPAA
jgi:LacI family transcriptional regulator